MSIDSKLRNVLFNKLNEFNNNTTSFDQSFLDHRLINIRETDDEELIYEDYSTITKK